MKTITNIALTAFLAAAMPFAAYADTKTTTTTTTTMLRPDVPVYTGVIEDVKVLEPLTLEDFQTFGTKPSAQFDLYQEYARKIENPTEEMNPVPYKMRMERQLTITDFQAPYVTAEVAEQRYKVYASTQPAVINGRDGRYVIVYHTPFHLTVPVAQTVVVTNNGNVAVPASSSVTKTVVVEKTN